MPEDLNYVVIYELVSGRNSGDRIINICAGTKTATLKIAPLKINPLH